MNINNLPVIRVATVEDAPKLLSIYAPYVESTAITFEYTVPTVEEFSKRIAGTLERFPYLVAQSPDGTILGYTYAGAFQSRKAYSWSVETTIYIDCAQRRSGLGRALYSALEEALKEMGITNLNACIAVPVNADETLTEDSVFFHEHMGYRMVGTFDRCGCKFGRWYNMCWMEKHIAPHVNDPEDIKPFPEIKSAFEAGLTVGMLK